MAYNTAEALNKTALAAQEAVREHMRQVFHERATTRGDRRWLEQRIKLVFASVRKGVIYAELYVDQKARLLLAAFETGEMREPFVGQNVAVPNPMTAREGGNVAGTIVPELTFKALKLKPFTVHPITQSDTVQYKGADRTFILKHTVNAPLGGVFQRIGPGCDDIRLVYSFHRAFKLKAVLDFLKIAVEIMDDKFPIEWTISNARNPSQ